MKRVIPLILILAAAACADQDPLGPEVMPGLSRAGSGELSVLNWNVYYGADLDLLLEETYPLPYRTALVFQQVMATNAPARAAAIARRIAEAGPHLVGLQEVARYRIQSPGDFLDAEGNLQNPFPNAETEVFDFLELVLQALAAEGVNYVVAARTTTLDAELPVLTASYTCAPCDDLRFTESIAILARHDVAVSNPREQVFAVNMVVEVSGFPLPILKGWASVDARVKERTYRFVTTHLEPADRLPGHEIYEPVHQVQLAQAAELLDSLRHVDHPVILTGDLNSEAGGTSTHTWAMMMGAGFVDTWLIGPPRGSGFTANQDADLMNAESKLWHRIDYVLFRDDFTRQGKPFRGAVHAHLVGHQQDHRTPCGLWPSDHAGIVAVLNTQQRATP